jgi:hypothetical protein
MVVMRATALPQTVPAVHIVAPKDCEDMAETLRRMAMKRYKNVEVQFDQVWPRGPGGIPFTLAVAEELLRTTWVRNRKNMRKEMETRIKHAWEVICECEQQDKRSADNPYTFRWIEEKEEEDGTITIAQVYAEGLTETGIIHAFSNVYCLGTTRVNERIWIEEDNGKGSQIEWFSGQPIVDHHQWWFAPDKGIYYINIGNSDKDLMKAVDMMLIYRARKSPRNKQQGPSTDWL